MKFQVEVERDNIEEIERLRVTGGMRTKKEVLGSALSLFVWAIREALQGRAFVSINNSDQQIHEVAMPALDRARRHGKRQRSA